MRVGPFMGASADSVADRVGGLSGVSTFGDARANEFVEFGKAGAVARERNRAVENLQQQIEQLVILRLQFTGAGILGEVGPIAVGANPDFETASARLSESGDRRSR